MKKARKKTPSLFDKKINKDIEKLNQEIDITIKKIFAKKQYLTIKDVVEYCNKEKYPELISDCRIKIYKTLLKVKDINILIFYQKKTNNKKMQRLITACLKKIKNNNQKT